MRWKLPNFKNWTVREKWMGAIAAASSAMFIGFLIARADFEPEWISAIVAVVALFAAIMAYLSSEETGRREHRAYVEVEPVKATIAILKYPELTFKVRNYGRTPCKLILHAQMRVLRLENGNEYPYYGWRNVENLHPGEAKEVVVTMQSELTDEEYEDVLQRQPLAGVQGWFDYFDVFDAFHHETFEGKVVKFE